MRSHGATSLGEHRGPMRVVDDSDHGYHGEKNRCGKVLRRFEPGIPMMEAAQPRV